MAQERYIITDEGIEFCSKIVLDHYRNDPSGARALADVVGLDLDAFLAKYAPRETHTEGPYR